MTEASPHLPRRAGAPSCGACGVGLEPSAESCPSCGAPSGTAAASGAPGAVVLAAGGTIGHCTDPNIPVSGFGDYTCPAQFQVPRCAGGMMVFTGGPPGEDWACAGDLPASRLCAAADAPEIDVVALVPGRPWCAQEAKDLFLGQYFIGNCPKN